MATVVSNLRIAMPTLFAVAAKVKVIGAGRPRRGPLAAMVLEGHEAVVAARQVIGATNPLEAAPGSIRGDFALEVGQNMVHGSDSNESAAREVGLFFPDL